MSRKNRIRRQRNAGTAAPAATIDRSSDWKGYLLCSLIVLFGLALAYTKAEPLKSWTWKRVPCSVETLTVGWCRPDESGSRPKIETRFTYVVDGTRYTATNAFIESRRRLDFTDAYDLAERFSTGRLVSCLINPGSPSVAVLTHFPFSHAGQSLFGLYFALIGLAAGYAVKGSSATFSRNQLPILWVALAGFMFGIGATSVGLLQAARALDWKDLETTIEHSGERLVRGGGGRSGSASSSLHPDIVYKYSYEGRTFLANTTFVSGGGPAFQSGGAEFLAKHPVGQTAKCWINPSNPAESVLDRSPGWGWVFALPALVLAGGLAIVIRKIHRHSAA